MSERLPELLDCKRGMAETGVSVEADGRADDESGFPKAGA